MVVMKVTSKSFGFLNNRNGYLTDNRFTHAIKAFFDEKVKGFGHFHFFEIILLLLEITNSLTSSSKDFWPVPSDLLFVFRIKP